MSEGSAPRGILAGCPTLSVAFEAQQPLQEIGSDSNVQAEKPVPTVAGGHHLGLLFYFRMCLA